MTALKLVRCDIGAEGGEHELSPDIRKMVLGLAKAETRWTTVNDALKVPECRQAANVLEAATSKGIASLRSGFYTRQSLQEDVAAVYDALVKGLSLGSKKGEGTKMGGVKKLLRDVRADPFMEADSFMEFMICEHQPAFIAATANSMEAIHDAALLVLRD